MSSYPGQDSSRTVYTLTINHFTVNTLTIRGQTVNPLIVKPVNYLGSLVESQRPDRMKKGPLSKGPLLQLSAIIPAVLPVLSSKN